MSLEWLHNHVSEMIVMSWIMSFLYVEFYSLTIYYEGHLHSGNQLKVIGNFHAVLS